MKIPTSARERLHRTGSVLLVLGFSFLAIPTGFASGREKPETRKNAPKSQEPDSSKALPNGIEVRHAGMLLQVLALRDDVLRVRLSANGVLPEDASWAVPAEIRHQRVDVTPDAAPGTLGFHTNTLSARIKPSSLRLSTADLSGNILQEDAEGWPAEFHSDAYRVFKKMPADEHYFGLGDKVGPLDRRGQAFRLWNTDAFRFQESTDPLYKSIPFFMTMRAGRSMGFLLDNTWSTSFDFGKSERNTYSFGAEGGPIDYYIFYGPDPKQVVETYAWLTGLPPLPPLWSLGFQQSRFSYETEARVREIASHLRSDKIPSDVLYLDIDFQKEHRPFTVDSDRFPHFEQMLSDLKREDFHVVAITDLHIARVPGAGYAPYDSGIAGDQFVKNPDGSAYVGTVWHGQSVFWVLTEKNERDWLGWHYKQLI
jgi:alpha-glucosidase